METLETNQATIKMKNLLDALISRFNITEKLISEFEGR